LHLQHPANAYRTDIFRNQALVNPVISYTALMLHLKGASMPGETAQKRRTDVLYTAQQCNEPDILIWGVESGDSALWCYLSFGRFTFQQYNFSFSNYR